MEGSNWDPNFNSEIERLRTTARVRAKRVVSVRVGRCTRGGGD